MVHCLPRSKAAAACCVLALSGAAHAESFVRPVTSFEQVYSGAPGSPMGRASALTSDGGYAIVGPYSTTSIDLFVVKLDAHGAIQWQKVYQAAGTFSDGYRIVQRPGGGYFVAGTTGEYAGKQTLAVLSLDASGTLLWAASYPTDGEIGILPYTLDLLPDGGLLVGASNWDAPGTQLGLLWGLRLDAGGNVVWQKAYDTTPGTLHPTPDGGAIAAGYDCFASGCYGVTLKLDAGGTPQWQRRYATAGTNAFAQTARPLAGGGYLLGGSYGDAGFNVALMMTLDDNGLPTGSQAWTAGPMCGGGTGLYEARPVSGGTLALFALSCTSPAIAKLDAGGAIAWQLSTNLQRPFNVLTLDVQPTLDGGVFATGSNANLVVTPRLLGLKLDRQGKVPLCPTLQLQSAGLQPGVPPAFSVDTAAVAVQDTHSARTPLAMTVVDAPLASADGCRLR